MSMLYFWELSTPVHPPLCSLLLAQFLHYSGKCPAYPVILAASTIKAMALILVDVSSLNRKLAVCVDGTNC